MKKILFVHLVLASAAAMTLQACGDDDSDTCSPASCDKPEHAIEMMCSDNGKCQVKVCDANFNVSDDMLSCEAVSTTCDPANCTKPDHASEMACVQNKCAISKCENGYHPNTTQSECISDTFVCNADACTKPANATQMTCIQNECAVAQCKNGYHPDAQKTSCEPNANGGYTNTTDIPECYANTFKCLNNNLMACQNGAWTIKQACNTQICDEQNKKCTDGAINPESVDVVTTQTCDYNTQESCEGSVAHFCNEDGFMTTRDCSALSTESRPLICQKMATDNFVDCVNTCDPDAWIDYTICNGKFVETHTCVKTQDGNYHEFAMTDVPCDYACHRGQCVREGEAPIDGESCDARFEKTCWNGDAYICRDGIITRTPCPDDTVCAMRNGSHEPVCTTKCKGAAYSTYGCKTENNVVRLDNMICELGQDAAYYLFPETDTCKSSCNQGLCDRDIPVENETCDPDKFEDVCFQNALYYCHVEKKVIQAEHCTNAMCRYLDKSYGFSSPYAECVNPCSEGEEPLLSCSGKGAKAYETRYECTLGSDGTFYRFYFENRCSEAGCNGDVCAE